MPKWKAACNRCGYSQMTFDSEGRPKMFIECRSKRACLKRQKKRKVVIVEYRCPFCEIYECATEVEMEIHFRECADATPDITSNR